MTTYIDTKIITISSQTATLQKNGTYLSHVQYELGQFIKDEPDIIHRQITLQSAQIPYSFYVINYTNNVFKGLVSTVDFTVIIPVGNYNANTLCSYLNTYFQVTLAYPTISFSVDRITGKLSWKYLNPTNDPALTLTFKKESTCQGLFGFASGIDYSGVLVPSLYVELLAPFPLNLLGPKLLQVRSSILNMTNYSSVHNCITTLLATISVGCQPFGMIDYLDNTNRVTFSNTSLDELDIEVLDGESGEFINFNNQDWTMTFAIHLTRILIPPPLVKPSFNAMPLVKSGSDVAGIQPTSDKVKNIPSPDLQLRLRSDSDRQRNVDELQLKFLESSGNI